MKHSNDHRVLLSLFGTAEVLPPLVGFSTVAFPSRRTGPTSGGGGCSFSPFFNPWPLFSQRSYFGQPLCFLLLGKLFLLRRLSLVKETFFKGSPPQEAEKGRRTAAFDRETFFAAKGTEGSTAKKGRYRPTTVTFPKEDAIPSAGNVAEKASIASSPPRGVLKDGSTPAVQGHYVSSPLLLLVPLRCLRLFGTGKKLGKFFG